MRYRRSRGRRRSFRGRSRGRRSVRRQRIGFRM